MSPQTNFNWSYRAANSDLFCGNSQPKWKFTNKWEKKNSTTNPLFASILCSSSFPSKSITVITRKCSPPKIKTLGHIAVTLSQAVSVLFSSLLLNLSPLSTFLLHKLHLSSWKLIISISFELSLSARERVFTSMTNGARSKVCHLQHVFVCVISYLLLWCCCRCWTVAPSARQAVWRQPSPAVAPTLCPGGWLTCSPSVCPGQCRCVLYLKVSRKGVKFNVAVASVIAF